MTDYQKIIQYFNSDNPDGDGFYLLTDQFFLDMDEYRDQIGNYYLIHLEDKITHVCTILKIRSEQDVYIVTAFGTFVLDQHNNRRLFTMIREKIYQMRAQMLKSIQIIMNN